MGIGAGIGVLNRNRIIKDALVMIVDGDREGFFGVVLADTMQIKLAFDLGRLGNINARLVLPGLGGQFFVEHLLAKDDAVIADINPRAGDELFDFGVGFAAKTAEGDISGPRHRVYSFLSAKLVARSASPGISLRDCTTSSTRP